jgi:enterochelin esterase-like enzyme
LFSVRTESLSRKARRRSRERCEHIKVHGKALEGNLEKDSPDRDVFIYLPPSYNASTAQRYPVVYLLHGYGLTAERWMPFTKMAEAADKNIAAGSMKEMILVNPDAYTIYNGSMYSSSVTTGDWESYIADDLVSYVDSHYRTIANRASRGLGGHSMGGYGTIRIGMKRPDVFSAMYIMSACCLLNNPRTPAAAGANGTAGQGARSAAPATAGANPPRHPQRHLLLDKRVRGPPERQIAAEVEADGAAVFRIQRPQRRQHGRRIQTILQSFSMNPLRMASFKHWWWPSGLRIRRWQ